MKIEDLKKYLQKDKPFFKSATKDFYQKVYTLVEIFPACFSDFRNFQETILDSSRLLENLLDLATEGVINQEFKKLLQKVDPEADHDHKTNIQFQYEIDTNLNKVNLVLTDYFNTWKVLNSTEPICFRIDLCNFEISCNAITDLEDIPASIVARLKSAWWEYIYVNLETWTQGLQKEAKELKNRIIKSEFGTI